jgi:hypothetical protein
MRDRNWRLLFLPSSYRKFGPRNRPSLLPSYPPARHGFVESRSLLGVELTAAQLVPLRVQPDAEVVRLAGDDRLCNARRYRRPGTPSAPPAVRATAPRPPGPAVFFPSRQDGRTLTECRRQCAGPGVLAAALQPYGHGPLLGVHRAPGRIAARSLDHRDELVHVFQAA